MSPADLQEQRKENQISMSSSEAKNISVSVAFVVFITILKGYSTFFNWK